MIEHDQSERLVDAVATACGSGNPVAIKGNGSKSFLVLAEGGDLLSTNDHTGIVEYFPDELVVTARSGTSLKELSMVLADAGQVLPFDPPRFAGLGTLGGAVAAGLSGPARPWFGSVRDAVLGVEIVNGLGERLTFGGQVLKNVAGYDVSRLMVGSFGTLGLILQVSVRVQPVPETVMTLAGAYSSDEAARLVRLILSQPLPVSATCYVDGVLRVRLSGSSEGVQQALDELTLDIEAYDDAFFAKLRDHDHSFFTSSTEPLWRISLPRGSAFDEPDALIEWAGACVWWRADVDAESVCQKAVSLGGYAQPFTGGRPVVSDAMGQYMSRVKAAFDPQGILNPGLMVA